MNKLLKKMNFILILCLVSTPVWAYSDWGVVANTATGAASMLTQFIIAASYTIGLGLATGSILKFKQHKDNPTQVHLSTPVLMLLFALVLVCLPMFAKTMNKTVFGERGGKLTLPSDYYSPATQQKRPA